MALKRIGIRLGTVMLAVAMLFLPAAIAAQDLQVNVNATAVPNVCSVIITSEEPDPFQLTWTGSEWQTGQAFDLIVNVDLNATGGPGDRTCYYSLSNDDFVNVDQDILLYSDALRLFGIFPLPQSIVWSDFPTGGPQSDSLLFVISTANVQQDASPGVYTSALTVTFSASPPP